MMKIIKNPIFKILGILLIIYFALLYDNSKKGNLRDRLTIDKIKTNFDQMRGLGGLDKKNAPNYDVEDAELKTTEANQKKSISENITKSEGPEEGIEYIEKIDPSQIFYKDLVVGNGQKSICGNHADIDLTSSHNGKVFSQFGIKVVIDNSDVINAQLIGMNEGGRRRVFVKDKSSKDAIKAIYDITLIKITDSKNLDTKNCKNNVTKK